MFSTFRSFFHLCFLFLGDAAPTIGRRQCGVVWRLNSFSECVKWVAPALFRSRRWQGIWRELFRPLSPISFFYLSGEIRLACLALPVLPERPIMEVSRRRRSQFIPPQKKEGFIARPPSQKKQQTRNTKLASPQADCGYCLVSMYDDSSGQLFTYRLAPES